MRTAMLCGQQLSHQHTVSSMRLFMEKVAPAYAKSDRAIGVARARTGRVLEPVRYLTYVGK
jgi:hypothetical protein